MPENIRKQLGICLCIFFGISLLETLINRIPFGEDMVKIGWALHDLLDIVIIVAILCLAFNSKFKSNLIAKVAVIICAISYLINIINLTTFIATDKHLIHFDQIPLYINILMSAIALIAFVWGLSIWKSIKIINTLKIIPSVMFIVAHSKMVASDYTEISDAIDNLNSITNVNSYIYIAICSLSLIFALVWMLQGVGRNDSAGSINNNTPKLGQQQSNTPQAPILTDKIPHK